MWSESESLLAGLRVHGRQQSTLGSTTSAVGQQGGERYCPAAVRQGGETPLSKWSERFPVDSAGVQFSALHMTSLHGGSDSCYTVGVTAALAPAPFRRTKIVRLVPRFVVVNSMATRRLTVAQRSGGRVDAPLVELPPGGGAEPLYR